MANGVDCNPTICRFDSDTRLNLCYNIYMSTHGRRGGKMTVRRKKGKTNIGGAKRKGKKSRRNTRRKR